MMRQSRGERGGRKIKQRRTHTGRGNATNKNRIS
jgi:hypothetical protein